MGKGAYHTQHDPTMSACQNIAGSDSLVSMNDWTLTTLLTLITSALKQSITSSQTNLNKNVITLVAHGHTLMAIWAVLHTTATATHAWSRITFPLSAVLSQHVGSCDLHPNKHSNHYPQQDTSRDRTGRYITSKTMMSQMVWPTLCIKQPTSTLQHHLWSNPPNTEVLQWLWSHCQHTFQGRLGTIVSKAPTGEIYDYHISLWQQQTYISTGKILNYTLCRRNYMPGNNICDDQWRKLSERFKLLSARDSIINVVNVSGGESSSALQVLLREYTDLFDGLG